jgi:uncharacterized protein involved in response to NO
MTLLTRWLVLAGRGEPYRILFPVGAIISVIGVMLWPLFVAGWLPFYPGLPHARIMVQGFVFSFVAGFLSSALPHMLEVKGISLGQTLLLAGLVMSVTLLHLAGFTPVADALFALTVPLLLVLIMRRWPERKDLPPPGFALAAVGLLSGWMGSIVLAFSGWVSLPLYMQVLAKLLLYHGFILFPVLGVGVYLLPRMVGVPNRHLVVPKSPNLSTMWIRRALFMLGCGLMLVVSFGLEAAGYVRIGFALRAVVTIGCLFREIPLFRMRRIEGSIPWALTLAAASMMMGLVIIAIFPLRHMTYLHVVFISGYGLLMLNISARVMLGHSGNGALIYARSTASTWITGLILLAMATRVSADLLPRMQLTHYAYAAITWMIVIMLWLMVYGPHVIESPQQTDPA